MANPKDLFDRNPAPAFWTQKTDDELLQLTLETDNPEGLQGISLETPPTEEAYFEMEYNVSGREQGRVRCVHCKYPNHFRGVVLRDKHGSRFLVGRQCAKNKHGILYSGMLSDFDNAIARKSAIARKRFFNTLQRDVFRLFRELHEHPAVSCFSQIKSETRSVLGDSLWKEACRLVQTGDSILRMTKRVRDYPAEQRRKEKLPPAVQATLSRAKGLGGLMPIWTEIDELGTRLRGEALFMNGAAVSIHLKDIGLEMRTAVTKLAGDTTSSREVERSMAILARCLKRVEDEVARLASCQEFFEHQNLQNFARWCKANDREGFRFEAQQNMFLSYENGRRRRVFLPEAYHVPGHELIQILRNAITVQPLADAA